MAYPYIDTPRTEVDANATYLTNGYRSVGRHNLSALDSVENSFQTPSKDEDVLKVLGDGRRRSAAGSKLSTPRATTGTKSARSALNSRQQLPTAAAPKGEFTPMLRSAMKNNYMKNLSTARGLDGPKTPAYLRASYRSNVNTPGLPAMEMTGIEEEDATVEDPTPLPQVASSSVQSTPLPGLSNRQGGVLGDGNNMTLKEQEKMIDQLDKANFGLKLKIHFLQEQLEKAGPAYNQAALLENTELKVSKLTMQRDISRYKKSLQQAERDLEAYRQQFQELREKMRRRQTDETIQRDMDAMREEIESRDQRIRDLQEQLRETKDSQSQEVEKLRDDIEDLEASLREKDRILDEREEEIEELKDKDRQETDALSELESELKRAKEQLEDLQNSLEEAKSEAREAKSAERNALEDKEKAEENLQELQDEMANKSFSTKGLTRQLEEKSEKLEEEIVELRQKNVALTQELESRTRNEASLEEKSRKLQQNLDEEKRKLQEDLVQARRERAVAFEEHDKVSAQLQKALDEIQRRTEEKDLLHTRHHALTDESGNLQSELAKAQSELRDLQETLDFEKQRAMENAENIRARYLGDIERLQEEIETLNHEIEDKEGHFALEQDRWESARRNLQLQKDRAEDQAAGFKRTIEKLEQVEHTLTGKEAKLQEVIDSEKARHFTAEAVLSRQVKELNDDLTAKREAIDQLRSDLLSVKEELRLTKRAESTLKEKVQGLEDEIVVLQSSLEEEQEYAKGRSQKGSSEQETQLHKILADKQKLRDQLANAHVELHDLKTIRAEIETERDELQLQLDQVQNQVEDTTKFDKEKVELRKSALRLESELKRLKDDKQSLLETKDSLEKQLSSEIERAALEENRLSAEVEHLQDKLQAASGGKERELALTKGKLQRFERRINELEDLLEQQQPAENEQLATSAADLSILRHNLDEVRKRERALLQREADQKSSIRTYKLRIVELEKELHDALMKKFEAQSLSSSPSSKYHEEVRNLRKQLSDAHRSLRELKSKNHGLERAAMREEDQRDLHELLKQSTLEAESLALQVSEREAQLSETKVQMRRIREERTSLARKAETAVKELEALHGRYKRAVEKTSSKDKTKHDKEIMGLGKEIIWLRARLKREEKFRRDLAWSKGLMELGERVRVACNEADLRMISEMGVKSRDRKNIRTPHAKLKTAVSMVKAVVRMQRMGREWKKTKKLGEGLKRAKNEVIKRREASNKALEA